MSTVILCQVRRADEPFYIDDVELNIYSIEELCYYMVHNIALLDEHFFSDRLVDWIKEQLRLRRLAMTLSECRKNSGALAEYVMPVLRTVHYLTPREEERLSAEIDRLEKMPVPMRMKEKADALVSHNVLMNAVSVYRDILNRQEKDNLGTQFLGTVWNNMGVAYARLFEMEEASSCMKNAWQMLHSQTTLHNYLFSVRMTGGRKALEDLAAELGVDRATEEEMERRVQELQPDAPPKYIQDAVSGWVSDYHRATRT